MEISQLDKKARKQILFDIVKISNRSYLEEKHNVSIPSSLFISYVCPICEKETSIRKLTNDIYGMSLYTRCRECGEGTAKASHITAGAQKVEGTGHLIGLERYFSSV